MDGLLLIDKPTGWTSFDVVAKVRGILRSATRNQQLENSEKGLITNYSLLVSPSAKPKVGHTGTLDPLATGLLVLTLGSYCKRAGEFSKLDKTYEVTMKLGQTSTTGDEEGEKTIVSNKRPEQAAIETVLKQFTGEIEQVPPAYSAIKVDGQRAYKLARAGKEVKLESRKVKIYSIQLTDYAYPEVEFTAGVSSGTYIRSLVEDIGKNLGTGAYMSNLRRLKVGDFLIKDAVSISTITSEKIERLLKQA